MYVELHCKTNFSFLEGASHADELVGRAAELGYRALAVTDRNSLAGIVRAHTAAKEAGVKLIVGAEIVPRDFPPTVLWVTDRAAYGRLCRLITLGRRRAVKGECELYFEDVAAHAEGMLAGVVASSLAGVSGLHDGRDLACASDFHNGSHDGFHDLADHRPSCPSSALLHSFRDVFGERGYLLAELHRGPQDDRLLARWQTWSAQTGLPLVAAGDVHYHVPDRMLLFDVLLAIRHGTTVPLSGPHRFANAERHLRSLDELRTLFARAPEAIQRTVEIAERCRFSLDELRYEYPEELAPQGMTPFEYLYRLTWKGAQRRYPAGIPDTVGRLLEHELQLIEELHYEAFFLTVWDLVRFARRRGILCQGRGSAANSAVCYCLGITSVDPSRLDVLFERFVSRERNEAPDIDVDFEHERREEVIQYLYQKYGRDRAGMAAEVITYRMRSAIRDAGKALGLSLDRVDALAKQIEGYAEDDRFEERCRQVGIDPQSQTGRQLVSVVGTLTGFPRHLSQHVGGMVMTRGPLCELVPIENAAMPGRTVICWDKNDLDDLGILKVDCLGLGMLTAIRKCFELVKKHTGRELTLANIPPGDTRVYDMICRADTMGVFQIESRAQMSMLPRLRPRCYYDLVIEVAIVRPGPIQGQMVHPYLRRRAGEEQVTYVNEEICKVLEKTLGVPIFQEQAMRLAVVAAGFTPGEADQLRRAMGAWRRPGIIDNFRHKLIQGMLERGLSEEFAESVFRQIRGFGEYGFPESHAASFALLVYVSAWLKCHYPAAFAAALINSQPMGFYAPAQLVQDAQRHAVKIAPIDVNFSDWDCTLEGNTSHALRLGWRLVVGLSQRHAITIQQARQSGPFTSLEDFTRRTKLSRAVVAKLAEADALGSLGRDRRQALWEALAQDKTPKHLPLFDTLEALDDDPVSLPEMQPLENVLADYETTGLTLRQHPLSFYRSELKRRGVITAAQLVEVGNRRRVSVAGLVLLRQRPSTAKGITFVTLEDETGTSNLILHQAVWDRFYAVARRSPAWVASGRLEAKYSVIHLVVDRLVDFGRFVQDARQRIAHRSRDFR
jgi:error-prone DNA polymerase